MQFLRVTHSNADKSRRWKLWHGINTFIAGWCFLIGSIVMFPRFTNPVYGQICGWLFTIGSACFLLADATEWLYFLETDFRYLTQVINFFINVVGSVLYLIGSVLFIPDTMHFYIGINFFIVGALLVMGAQTWKLVRLFQQPDKKAVEILGQQTMTVFLDVLAALGALFYFIGSFVFQKSAVSPQYTTVGAVLFCVGAAGNCTSSILVFYRYFYASKTREEPLLLQFQKQSVLSTVDN